MKYLLQLKLFNVITLGPGICDRINRMITKTNGFYLYFLVNGTCDYNKRLIVLTISAFQCIV